MKCKPVFLYMSEHNTFGNTCEKYFSAVSFCTYQTTWYLCFYHTKLNGSKWRQICNLTTLSLVYYSALKRERWFACGDFHATVTQQKIVDFGSKWVVITHLAISRIRLYLNTWALSFSSLELFSLYNSYGLNFQHNFTHIGGQPRITLPDFYF